ncbi:GCN5 family acetyltransferase [Exiguobacterium indicum]|uniref:GNAT family N-acetyltransferase n=1 Tax=Exiguobacterium indicum TaxID=296995 RepID=UPI000737A70A|nr:GNAT family N-acetyltransferase [Exiguobacterium indicum]KTR58302.1 GCN5 family acetyltransferase [Exiguobacterium indicum]
MRIEQMSQATYDAYLPVAIEEYAAEKCRAGTWSENESLERATQEFATLLPEGLKTKDHYLFTFRDETGNDLGMVWVHVREESRGRCAFIFDIKITSEKQNQGYGKEALRLLEVMLKRMNVKKISLHVFAHNERAIHVYDSLGYETTDYHMSKRLEDNH